METLLIIICLYILNVFIGRYLNIKMLKYNYSVIESAWFIPILPIIAFGLILIEEYIKIKGNNKFIDWFLLRHRNQ